MSVACAYVDQLERSQALSAKQIADLNKAIARAQKSNLAKKDVAKLSAMAPSLETTASSAKTPADANRLQSLAQILKAPTV